MISQLITFLIFNFFLVNVLPSPCAPRQFEHGQVCVCNSSYCDQIPPLKAIAKDEQYQIYSTSKASMGFNTKIGNFENIDVNPTISVDESTTFQKVYGFGGAFTDSFGINIASLPEDAQENLLESYFGESGIQYNLCRVPIGGTDFSTRAYSYDDVEGDNVLEHFKLQPEDINYKIPFIQKAIKLRSGQKNLRLFASAWTAPPWMKTRNNWSGGFLQPMYYQLWADYYMRFFEEYEKHNINFWAMTTGNEPLSGIFPSSINSMGWYPWTVNQWIGDNMGPTIQNSTRKDLKIIIHDDSRLTLFLLPLLLNNDKTLSYVSGVGVHWYVDSIITVKTLQFAKTSKKDLFILNTEACTGYLYVFGLELAVRLGSWDRGDSYISDIITDMQNGMNGWVDWNMALNLNGGPNYIDNNVDAPIIVNADNGEFYKQPMFYALGHFSKFVVPDSVRIQTKVQQTADTKHIKALSFLRPDGLIATILYNSGSQGVVLYLEHKQKIATCEVEAYSINTILF